MAHQGEFVTLYPDLGIVRVGRKNDKWLLIGELKRSPKRGFIFNVDLKQESKGWIDLHAKITSAISQVECQAYTALDENPNQEENCPLCSQWTILDLCDCFVQAD